MRRFALVLLAACSTKSPRAAATPSNAPTTWLDAPVNVSVTLDLAALRADPTFGRWTVCAPKAKHDRFPGLATLPCRAELIAADRADLWMQLEPDEPESSLLVVRGAEAARACVDADSPGKPLAANLVEHVRIGQTWSRIYVLGADKETIMLLPVGAAAAATRAALVAGRPPPPAYRLPPNVLAHAVLTFDLFVLLAVPDERDAWGSGLVDLALKATSNDRVTLEAHADLAGKVDADSLAQRIEKARDRLVLYGSDVKIERPFKTQVGATFDAPAKTIGALCE